MAQVYTAQSVTGVVSVVSATGQTRTLKAGDRVLKGETLVTGARGRAELVTEDALPICGAFATDGWAAVMGWRCIESGWRCRGSG